MVVRQAGPEDLRTLLTLYEQLNPGEKWPSIEEAEGILASVARIPGSRVYIVEIDGKVVASCTLIVIPNLTRNGRPYALIENVITDVAHRKRGYGQFILRHAVSQAWEHDCYKVMLMTGSSDPKTLRFYKSAGFEQSKTGFQVRRHPVRGS